VTSKAKGVEVGEDFVFVEVIHGDGPPDGSWPIQAERNYVLCRSDAAGTEKDHAVNWLAFEARICLHS
jgi:hypothetical protein